MTLGDLVRQLKYKTQNRRAVKLSHYRRVICDHGGTRTQAYYHHKTGICVGHVCFRITDGEVLKLHIVSDVMKNRGLAEQMTSDMGLHHLYNVSP